MRKVLLTVLGLMCVLGLSAQWTQENLRVTVDKILDFEAQTNKDGVTFVGFWDLVAEDPEKQGNRYSDGSDVAYSIQILDKDGTKVLTDEEKQLISHEPTRSFTMGYDRAIFTDSDGNALYIVKDERNCNSDGGYDQGYFVYKISPAGELLWEEPLDLNRGYAYYLVANIKVIELSNGSYIFAHDIYLNGSRSYIAIERVSKNGELLWDEPLLLTDNTIPYNYSYLADAGYGNFIVAYAKNGSQMYAQKFAFDKENLWPNEVPIYRGGFTVATWLVFDIIPDQKGGIFASWYDDRYNSKFEKVYASHILSNGTQGFVTSNNEEGLQLNWNENMRGFRPLLCYDPDREILYAAWEEDDSDQTVRSVVLQKISKSGELLWTNPEGEEGNTNGWILDSGTVGYYTIQLAGEGKIAVFHQHAYNTNSSVENIATLLDVSGEQPQSFNRLVFSEKGVLRSGLVSLPLIDNEYFLTFWNDYRTSTLSEGAAVFAHKISLADLGFTSIRFPETGSNSRFEIFSGGANGKINFVLDSSTEGNATLHIYSVSGQKTARIQSKLHAGENIIPWNVQHLTAGVYIAQIITQNGIQTKRFIIK
jgi:hypothetical protein